MTEHDRRNATEDGARARESAPRPLVAVTGASSGIGAALAEEFAAAGHPVLALARRADKLAELDLPRGVCAAVDLLDAAATEDAVRSAEEVHGPVDLLINNAGIMPLGRVATQDPEEWRDAFEVNCLALLRTSQLVLPSMIERRSGTIVNVSSVAGRNIYPNHTVYTGTKFAVHAMTESMRREYAEHGVRFIVIAPGLVETDLLATTSDPAVREAYVAGRARLGGGLNPRIVARAVRQAYEMPQQVCVREIVIAPTAQAS